MTLLRELPQERQDRYFDASMRQDDVVRNIFLQSGRRAVIFLSALLILGVAVTVALSIGRPSASRLFVASLGCFLAGLIFVGLLNALNFEVSRLVLQRVVGRANKIFRNELPIEAGDVQAIRPAIGYVTSGLGYVAFVLWILGAVAAYQGLKSENTGLPAHTLTTLTPIVSAEPRSAPAPSIPESPSREHPYIWGLSDTIATISSIAAFLQFIALIATFWVMRNTARRQLRAYAFPDSVGLYDGSTIKPPQPQHASEPGVVIEIKNFGQTPAYRLLSWGQIAVIEPINEDKLLVPDLVDVAALTLPCGGTSTKSLWFGRPLSTAEIADVQSRVRAIYVYGRIEYRDVYSRKRYSNFRVAYSGQFPPTSPVAFNFCNKGNEAD